MQWAVLTIGTHDAAHAIRDALPAYDLEKVSVDQYVNESPLS